jgi:hypothetical protein
MVLTSSTFYLIGGVTSDTVRLALCNNSTLTASCLLTNTHSNPRDKLTLTYSRHAHNPNLGAKSQKLLPAEGVHTIQLKLPCQKHCF